MPVCILDGSLSLVRQAFSSQVLKKGTKVKSIRLVGGDHDVDCKIDGISMSLKSEFLKKA